MKRRGAAFALSLLWLLAGRVASAQLGQNGDPIRTSRYGIDLHQGPVTSATRIIGLAGAYVALAEGVDGNDTNPAAPAVRTAWSTTHVDYDVGLGLTFPAAITRSDFYNTGRTRTEFLSANQNDFVFFNADANLQVGTWGFGLSWQLQRLALQRSVVPAGQQDTRLSADISQVRFLVANAFARHQLIVGTGLRISSLTANNDNAPQGQPSTLFNTVGAAPSMGLLWRPIEQHFRVGAAFHSAFETNVDASGSIRPDAEGNLVVGAGTSDELYLPEHVSPPWTASVGVAFQVGPRPLNPRWLDPDDLREALARQLAWRKHERERYRRLALDQAREQGLDVASVARAIDAEQATEARLDQAAWEEASDRTQRVLQARIAEASRWYVLVSTQLLATGALRDAVGVESFVQRAVDRSGRRVSWSPRIGMETEPVPRWFKVRLGAYEEPTRFEGPTARARMHTTAGLDFRLVQWPVFGLYARDTVWRISGAIDVADRYLGLGGTIGVWH